MTLLLCECRKLYTRRYVIVIILIAILNVFLFTQDKYSDGVEKSKIVQVYEDIADLSIQESRELLEEECELLQIDIMQNIISKEQMLGLFSEESIQKYAQNGCKLYYCTDSSTEYNLINYVLKEVEEITNHPQYLEKMQQSAYQMSKSELFGNTNSFSNRNILRTAQKYADLQIQTVIASGIGVESLTTFGWTDCLILLLLISGAILLVATDRENGMQRLLQTTERGRTSVFRIKYVTLLLHTILITGLLIGMKSILVQLFYGFGDLSRPIQAVPDYLWSVLPWNVGQTLFVWLMLKLLVYWMFASVAFCLSTRLRRSTWVLLSMVILFGFGYIAVKLIDPYGSFSLLVTVNPITILQIEYFFQDYQNTNLMGYPVSSGLLCSIAIGLLVIIVFLLSDRFFRHPEYMQQTIHMSVRRQKLRVVTNLFRQEAYIFYISGYVAVLLLIFTGIETILYSSIDIPETRDDLYLKEYMSILEGSWTKEKEDFICAEREKIARADQELMKLDEQIQSGELTEFEADIRGIQYQKQKEWQVALDRVEEQLPSVKDGTAQFLYDTGYGYLLGSQGRTRGIQNMAVCAGMLMLCIVPYKCREYESGMIALICTMPRGRKKRIRIQFGVCLTLIIPCVIIAWLPDIIYIGKQFGYNGVSAPIQSLTYMIEFPLTCSILQFFILVLTGILVCMGLIVLLFYAISMCIKKTVPAVLVSGITILMMIIGSGIFFVVT